MQHPPNNAIAVSHVGEAIETLQSAMRGTLIQGAPITPDGEYKGTTLRTWLESLRDSIDDFLKDS